VSILLARFEHKSYTYYSSVSSCCAV